MSNTVLHLAPHPDDELIGAPATLMALRDAGWRVVNFACSFGAPDIAARREAELAEACTRARFELIPAAAPLGDPLSAEEVDPAQASIQSELSALIERLDPVVVVCPSPHDRHRGHEVVARAAVRALETCRAPGRRLWMWGLWADLPFPTVATAFGESRLAEILHALGAHRGELDRSDYRRVVRGRAEANASLGPERVFGFGSTTPGDGYVELLSEVGLIEGAWRLGAPRWLDTADPTPALSDRDIGSWVHADSLTSRFGPPGE